jgi:hypothetical protein
MVGIGVGSRVRFPMVTLLLARKVIGNSLHVIEIVS